jgi:hypothetical protein
VLEVGRGQEVLDGGSTNVAVVAGFLRDRDDRDDWNFNRSAPPYPNPFPPKPPSPRQAHSPLPTSPGSPGAGAAGPATGAYTPSETESHPPPSSAPPPEQHVSEEKRRKVLARYNALLWEEECKRRS